MPRPSHAHRRTGPAINKDVALSVGVASSRLLRDRSESSGVWEWSTEAVGGAAVAGDVLVHGDGRQTPRVSVQSPEQ